MVGRRLGVGWRRCVGLRLRGEVCGGESGSRGAESWREGV